MTIWITSPSVPVRQRPPAPARVRTETPVELAALKSALDAIPNSGEKELSYDEWRNLIFGIHYVTGGSDAGLELAHELSSRSARYDPEFLDSRVWGYINSERSGGVVTDRTVFHRAAMEGWQNPTILGEFEVIEEPPEEAKVEAAKGGDTPTRFRVLDEGQFLDAPPVRWLIKYILAQAEIALMFGDSGSGKSFMALDLAVSISLGIAWRGHKTTQGRVIYVAAEGAAGFRKRLKAYRQAHEVATTGVQVIAGAPNLLEKADAIDVTKAILARGKADLVIIDTLAQSMPGGNENSGEDVGRVLAHCKGIHRATGAMVLLVHHSGKDSAKGARGWSGLRAAVDVELEVMRSGDDRVMTVTKQKDGEDGAQFGFQLETVLIDFDDDGDDVTSCVVRHCDAAGEVIDRRRAKPLGDVEKAVMQAMEDSINPGADVVPDARIALAAKEMIDPPDQGKRDTRMQRIGRAIESLIAGGRMRREDGGLALGGTR